MLAARGDGHRLAGDEPARVTVLAAAPASVPRSCGCTAPFLDADPASRRHPGRDRRRARRRGRLAPAGAGRGDRRRRRGRPRRPALPARRPAARDAGHAGRPRHDPGRAAGAAHSRRGARPTRAGDRRHRRPSWRGSASRSSARRCCSCGLQRRAGIEPARGARHAGVRTALPAAASRCTTPRAPSSSSSPTVGETPLRVHPALVETDLVIAVTAAETVLHGGPATLAARSPQAVRGRGRSLAARDERVAGVGHRGRPRAGARRDGCGLIGVSLVLNHPRVTGVARGYPYEDEAVARTAGPPLRLRYGLLPASRASGSAVVQAHRAWPRPSRAGRRSRTRRRCCARSRRVVHTPDGLLDVTASASRDDAVPPAGAAEPAARRLSRARSRAPALARPFPPRGGEGR